MTRTPLTRSSALAVPLVLVALGGMAFAVDYRLNTEGGAADLGERVSRAFERWAAVEGGEVTFDEVEGADTVIRYGDGTRFGPDTLSLTVQRSPDAETRVLLNPTLPDERALLHEVGLLLGLSPIPLTQSVMNPLLPLGGAAEPTPADAAALRALVAFVPEDINQDGTVDFYDLAALGGAYGARGVNLPEDITGDGVVDGADLERLRAAYVFGAPSEVAPEEALAAGDVTSPSDLTGGAMTGGAMAGGAMTGGTMTGGVSPVMTGGAMTGGAGPEGEGPSDAPPSAQTGGGR